MKVRNNLSLVLKNRGLSLRGLARETGIPRIYLGYIADGRMVPSAKQLQEICGALQVTEDMIYPDPTVRAALEE